MRRLGSPARPAGQRSFQALRGGQDQEMARDVSLTELLQELAEQRDFDFRGYKKSTLERRFRRRMFQLNLGGYGEYGNYIRAHPNEVNDLLNTLLINVTEFFRDPPSWELLRHEVLPPLFKR